MIEFAIAFSLLFPVFVGTFQFGYAFFLYNQLKAAVREGARYASLKTYDSNSNSYTTAFGNAVKNIVVYGNPNGGSTPVVTGLSTSNVTVSVTFANNVPSQVTVGIQGYRLNAVFTTYTLNKPLCTFPYTGRYAPDGI